MVEINSLGNMEKQILQCVLVYLWQMFDQFLHSGNLSLAIHLRLNEKWKRIY